MTAPPFQQAAAPTFQRPASGQHRPATAGVAGQLEANVIATVKAAAANAPRSRQAGIGPSEIGTPCMRRLAYKSAGWDPCNADTDPWASIIGTAVHAWMADTYSAVNRDLGRVRYFVERRVPLPGMPWGGSTDLYDRDWQVNNDWKVTGLDKLRKYRKNGPGQQYRVQAHTYGLGLQMIGETPKDVAITFLPRGGRITDLYVWSEPYDALVAVEYLNRYQSTRDAVVSLDPEANPAMWAMFPTAATYCEWCPFHLPFSTDLSKGCPGHKTNPPNPK